jgi:hypothetical protein
VRVFLSQSSLSIGEMIVFLSALRNIGDVLGSALFFFKRKDFFISFMFLREQSWRNSFALKRGWDEVRGTRYEVRGARCE